MISKIFPKLHSEGYKFIVIAIILTIVLYIFSNFLGRFNSSTRNSKKTRLLKLLEKLPSYDIKTILLKLPKQTTR